jgi:hypothetical protein
MLSFPKAFPLFLLKNLSIHLQLLDLIHKEQLLVFAIQSLIEVHKILTQTTAT